jgi:DUF1009 family protein
MNPPIIGILAGDGEVPVLAAQSAREKGCRVVAIGFSRRIASDLAPHVDAVYHFGVGQPRKIWAALRSEGAKDIVFLGRINKRVIFNPRGFDDIALDYLRRLTSKDDRPLMEGIVERFEAEGFIIRNQTDFLEACLVDTGVLSDREPTEEEWGDVHFGFAKARGIASLDIGETVVVKDKAVIAVEAVEGTNACIERACREVEGAVVVKVTRRHRDFRLDVPAIGPETIELLVKGKASVLALEAGRIYVLEEKAVRSIARRGGLAIVACDGPEVCAPPEAEPTGGER